jgi:purine-nucleoside phosphorylase
MNASQENVNASLRYIREHAPIIPGIGLILGSGLGDFADTLPRSVSLPTRDIPHYPVSSVEGHKGRLVFAVSGDRPILAFQGRIHFYESNDVDSVLYPIHIANGLGIRTLIVTNAAGGINRAFNPGDLMLITDQINLTGSKIPGPHPPVRPVISVYSQELIERVTGLASENNISLKRGVYAGLKGPSYETASEIEMIHRLGGDAVGMSTVLEVSLAARFGMAVVGISCITNYATGITMLKLNHTEVTDVAKRVKPAFSNLVSIILSKL